MSNELTILLKLDRSQAQQQSAAFHQQEKRRISELLTDTEIAEKAKQAIVQKTNQQQTQEAVKSHKTQIDLKKEEQEAWERSNTQITNAISSVGSFITASAGIGSVSSVAGVVSQHFKDIQNSIYDSAKMTRDFRAALTELASLKGLFDKGGGGSTEAVQQNLALRRETLQTAQEATAFENIAIGVGEAIVDKPGMPGLISGDDFKKYSSFGGALGVTKGMQAGTMGNLVGKIPQLIAGEHGGHVTGDQAKAGLAQFMAAAQPGAFTPEVAASQIGEIGPMIQAGTFKFGEASALMSMMSLVKPDSAGTAMERLTRATIGNVGRVTGRAALEGGEKAGAYYKELGFSPQSIKHIGNADLVPQMLERITKDVMEKKAEATSRGEEFHQDVYLGQHGFQDQEAKAAMVAFIEMNKMGLWENKFKPFAQPSDSYRQDAEGSIQRFRTDPASRPRFAELASDQAKLAGGLGTVETAEHFKKMAFESRKANRLAFGDYEKDIQGMWSIDPQELIYGRRSSVESEAQSQLENQAMGMGIPGISKQSGGGFGAAKTGEMGQPAYKGDKYIYELAEKIRGAGGDPNKPFVDSSSRAVDASITASQKMSAAADLIAGALGKPPALPTGNAPRALAR